MHSAELPAGVDHGPQKPAFDRFGRRNIIAISVLYRTVVRSRFMTVAYNITTGVMEILSIQYNPSVCLNSWVRYLYKVYWGRTKTFKRRMSK